MGFSNPSWVYRFESRKGVTRVYAPTGRLAIEAEMGVFPSDWPLPVQQGRYPALAHPVKVWLGLRPGNRGDWALTIRIPQRLRPSPLNLIVKDSRPAADPISPDRVDFRGADFDPF